MVLSFARGAFAVLCFAAVAARAVGAVLPAPSPTPSAAPTAVPEIGRVVTSDRRAEPIGETSRPTFVVTRTQIDAYGARTVADALRGVPGVELFTYGPFGGQVDYGIRGALPSQALILVDGISVEDATTGTALINQLSTIGVQRIEVVESGSSTLYGTNASGGVINIITSVPRGAYLAASTGSFGDRDLRLAFGNGRIGASVERHVSIGDYPYPAFAYGPTTAFPAGVRADTYGTMSAGRLGVDEGSDATLHVRARLDLSASSIGVPGRLDFLTPNAAQTTADNSAFVDLGHAAGASLYSLSAGTTSHRLAYVDLSNGGESDTYSSRAQLSLKDVVAAGRFDVVAGIDAARETGVFVEPGSTVANVGAAQAQTAAYLQTGYAPYPRSHVVLGARAENDGAQGSVVDPSFGGVLPFGTLRLAGNVAETFRVPTLQDLYFPGFSNPKLVPERAQASDVTLAADGRGVTYSLGWFARGGSNFIVYDPVQLVPINEQRAQSAGLAATASAALPGGLTASAGLTDLYLAIDTVTAARLPRSPVGQATLTLSHPFGATRFEYGARWDTVGSDGDAAANVSPLVTSYDSYNTLDAYLRYRLTSGVILSARGFNLANTQYAPIYGYPAPGRSWTLEVSTR